MWKRIKTVSTLIALTIGLSGCGKEQFVKQQYSATASAIGFRQVPSKVDIVIVVDNTGSITSAFSSLQSQLSGFVNSLANKYWDYHVARVLISNPSPINKVLVDSRFNQAQLPDGSANPSTDIVPSQYAVTDASQFTLLSAGEVGAALVTDPTYTSLVNTVKAARDNDVTNFFRPDALLAIIIVTNGVAREVLVDPTNPQSDVSATRLATWANNIAKLKTDVGAAADLIRFYPIASPTYRNSGCYSGGANWGGSYFMMSNYFQGVSGDVCNTSSMSTVLANIESDLDIVRESYIMSWIVLADPFVEGDVQSILKNGSPIPKWTGGSNGWRYVGPVSNQCTVTAIQTAGGEQPYCANIRSGYGIELLGSSRLHGNDTLEIVWEAPGQTN